MDILTKKCFDNGLPASQWLQVLRVCPDYETLSNSAAPFLNVLETLLDLLAVWPANQLIIEYLAEVVKSQTLPLDIFVPIFLRATRKPDLGDPRSLDMLCRLIINASMEMPLNALINVVNPIEPVAMSLLDAYNLLRAALGLPYSPLHDLQTSSQGVLFLMLQHLLRYSQAIFTHFTTTEALQFLTVGNEILQHANVRPDLANTLESVNRLFGELLTVTDALPSAHPEILGIGLPPPELPPAEMSDAVSLSLFLRNIVDYRAHPYGCGSGDRTVAILIGLFKWSGSSISAFCADFIGASFLHFLESFQLPVLLQRFAETAGSNSPYGVIEMAVTSAFEKLQGQLDFALPFQASLDVDENITSNQNPTSFRLNLLHALVRQELLTVSNATAISSDWSEETRPPAPLLTEMSEALLPMQEFVDGLTSAGQDELKRTLDSFVADPSQQRDFAEHLLKKFAELSKASDLAALANLCEALCSHSAALDVIALHISIPSLLGICLNLIDSLDWESMDDPQTAMIPFGSIVIFMQSTIGRFKISPGALTTFSGSMSVDNLMQIGNFDSTAELDTVEAKAYDDWRKTLFDPSVDGVDESLVRSNNPKILLRLSPILVLQAIKACNAADAGLEKLEHLRHGIEYFQGPLLSWTLAGVIRSVALEMERSGVHAPVHAEALQLLVKSAPAPVLKMVQRTLSRVLSIPVDLDTAKQREGLVTMLQSTMRQIQGQVTLSTYTHKLAPTGLIGAAFMSLRSHRAVSLDVPLCLRMMGAAEFLMLMQKLHSGNHLGDQDSTWRIAVHALCQAAQAGPDQPWLLPVYLFSCIPRILAGIGPHETHIIDLLSIIITSSLRLSLCIDKSLALGSYEPSMLVAERFSQFLKKGVSSGSVTSRSALLKSLQSSQPLCSQFPCFV